MPNAHVSHQNGDMGSRQRFTRWLTPKPLVEALGAFDLDPAGAPGHELASRTYLPENGEDGLVLPWEGRVWLNPPYGREMYPFLQRMVEHDHGTALVFARTDARWFEDYVWQRASAVLFLRGRLTFLRPDGQAAGANAGAGSCLVAYGDLDAEILYQAVTSGALQGRIVNLHTYV